VQTNVVLIGISRTGVDSGHLASLLKERGLLVGTVDRSNIRLLTHLDVNRDQIQRAVGIFKRVLQGTESHALRS